MIIKLIRTRKTSDGIFGVLTFETLTFTCFTLENLEKSIIPGQYEINFNWSNRFKKVMPHIIVPYRDQLAGGDAGIRIHPANYSHQLEGCIAVGDSTDSDAINNSKSTFEKLYAIIKDDSNLSIIIRESL